MSTEYHFCISQVGKLKRRNMPAVGKSLGKLASSGAEVGGAHGQPSGESVGLYHQPQNAHTLWPHGSASRKASQKTIRSASKDVYCIIG